MKNNRYKNAFNQIEVSDRAIDNLYDIATKKQRRTNNVAKKIIATATAFILVIGGGTADYFTDLRIAVWM